MRDRSTFSPRLCIHRSVSSVRLLYGLLSQTAPCLFKGPNGMACIPARSGFSKELEQRKLESERAGAFFFYQVNEIQSFGWFNSSQRCFFQGKEVTTVSVTLLILINVLERLNETRYLPRLLLRLLSVSSSSRKRIGWRKERKEGRKRERARREENKGMEKVARFSRGRK